VELREGSINDLSHTIFPKRSDFKELGTSQHIVEDMLDNSFKELRIATWLKNRMGEVINRPLLRA